MDELIHRMSNDEFVDWMAEFMLESGEYLPVNQRKSPQDLYAMFRDMAKKMGARDGRK